MQITRMDPNHNASIQGDIQLTILSLLYSGCSRRLHLKCMCYRGAVEHLGRQQGDLREIENSQMQDCLWLSVQDVPCVQKIRMPSWSRFPVADDAHMRCFSNRDISNRNSEQCSRLT